MLVVEVYENYGRTLKRNLFKSLIAQMSFVENPVLLVVKSS